MQGLTDTDRKEILEYALKRSREILSGCICEDGIVDINCRICEEAKIEREKINGD